MADRFADNAPDPAPPASPGRLGFVLGLIAFALLGLVGRVAYLQTVHAQQTAARAERQQSATETLAARRGSIFDRNGLMLAGSMQLTTVYADPKFMHEQYQVKGRTLADMDAALEQVARLVNTDAGEVALAVGRDANKRYVPIARGVPDEIVAELKALDVPGLGFEAEPSRVYPMGQTAAHLLGAVGREDKGLEGLERLADATLAGYPGAKGTTRDKRRRAIAAAADEYRLPRHGEHLILTIDSNIQLIAEQELEKAVKDGGASGGCVVVMDPQTGDVLALANYPSYFPQYLADSAPDARRNRAVTDPFEPGSILKPFLVAGLIERGVTRIDEVIDLGDSRFYKPYPRRTIKDIHFYGPDLPVWDVLVKSSNVGMVKIGEKTDAATLTDVMKSFGFGAPTGLGVGGENGGRLPPKWGWGTRESIMQGYALLATPVQLARAMSAIANDGRLVTPRLVAGHMSPGGEMTLDVSDDLAPQVIDPMVARQVRRVLADVPLRGTAKRARLDRWNVFGKTGTAHRAVNGHYDEEHYVSSFVGGAPAEAPRLVIAISIYDADKRRGPANTGHHGGFAAAPAAAKIIERSLDYFDVPDSPDLPEPPAAIVPHLWDYKPNKPKAG